MSSSAPDYDPDNPDTWIPGKKTNGQGHTVGRLRILGIDDLLALPARDYLLKGVISPAEISLLVGAKNARKTFTALHVGYGLAHGWPRIFGRRVKQTPTLYMIAEGEAGIGKRVKALVGRYGRCDAFHVIAQPIDLLRSNATAGDLHDAIAVVRLYGIGMVIVDTVSRAMMGGDENGPVDMGTLAANLNTLRHETGAHVMGVHHGTQQDGTKSRGHSSLPFSADAILQIEWNEEEAIGNATVGFCRDDVIGSLCAFRTEVIHLGVDADGDPITTLLIKECGAGEAPSKRKGNGVDRRFGRLGVDARMMFRAIENLLAEGQGEVVTPRPDIARLTAVSRQTLRDRNIRDEWHGKADVTHLASELASSETLTQRGWEREHKALKALNDKDLIGFTRDWVWLA
jgi:hypothetical protein